MADASIEFKGSSFTLSVLHLRTSALADIRADLTKKVAQAPDFFYLVPVMVNIEKLSCPIDYQAIKTLIEESNFTFVGFTGAVDKEQRLLMRELGFSFVNTAKAPPPKKSAVTSESTVAENVLKETAEQLPMLTLLYTPTKFIEVKYARVSKFMRKTKT